MVTTLTLPSSALGFTLDSNNQYIISITLVMKEIIKMVAKMASVIVIVAAVFFVAILYIKVKAKEYDDKLLKQDIEEVEALIDDGYEVYLEGEKKDAKTLDLSQYEISIDDENKIVKLTRNERREVITNRTVIYPLLFH